MAYVPILSFSEQEKEQKNMKVYKAITCAKNNVKKFKKDSDLRYISYIDEIS